MAAKSWPVGFCNFFTSIRNRTENSQGRVINKHIHVEKTDIPEYSLVK